MSNPIGIDAQPRSISPIESSMSALNSANGEMSDAIHRLIDRTRSIVSPAETPPPSETEPNKPLRESLALRIRNEAQSVASMAKLINELCDHLEL